MDLNAPPLPEEEDEEAPPEDHGEEAPPEDHGGEAPPKNHGGKAPKKETTVELMRREREERRLKLKRTREQQPQPQEGPIRVYDDDLPQKRPVLVQNPNSGFGYHDRNNQNTGFRYDDRNNQNTEFRYDDRNKLPHGWLDCPSHGQLIGNCIIPSKVPLSDYFDEFIPFGKRYSMKQVLDKQQRKLGLVIDLTNTTRYYRAADWKRHGVDHVKIPCKGRDSVPDNGSVNSFLHHILKFRKRSNKNILVHCTHGHNRTGYMIVHFLMRTCFQPMSVTEAIQAFADARPPGIYKKDYIDALYAFYHEKKPQAVICPSTPEWKRSTEIDLNGEAPLDDDDGWPGPLNEESVVNEVLTLDDVLGDTVPYEQQEEMRAFCYESLELGVGPKGTSQFPGSHPVSLNRDNLQFLRQRYYYATWKADGTRYMMLIKRDGCYLIDRKFNFRRVQMRFPCRQSKDSGLAAHHFTLLDGEMVIDIRPDTQKQERRYLIYDLIAVNNVSIVKKPFEERWKMIEEEIVQPRNIERERNIIPYYRYDMEPFRVRRKDFWLLSTVPKLLKELIPRLSHESDGLIFQGWHDPYVPRTHEGLLKWKYAEMNSVDFLFELDDDCPQLFLNEKGRKKLMEGNRVMFKDESDPSEYAGKIIECSWDSKEDVWVCMRIRTDKSVPNEFNTYKKVMRSIKDNITEEVLLNEINETVRLPMYVDRMKRDQQSRTGRRK